MVFSAAFIMEKKLGLVHGGLAPRIDGPQPEPVLPGKVSAREDDSIPQAPTIAGRQLAPGKLSPGKGKTRANPGTGTPSSLVAIIRAGFFDFSKMRFGRRMATG